MGFEIKDNVLVKYRKEKGVTEVVIPDGVTEIGDKAFENHEDITKIVVPEGVITIGEYSFSFCRSLTEIKLPESITEIKKGTFKGCKNLTDINLPSGITKIEEGTFSSCDKLSKIVIPDGCTEIEKRAFWGCGSLSEVILPDTLTQIGERAFILCPELTEINIPYGVKVLPSAIFDSCKKLKKVILPESIERIGEDSFRGCKSLADIVIPAGVKEIDDRAFKGCTNLFNVKLPESLPKLGKDAFGGTPYFKEFIRNSPANVESLDDGYIGDDKEFTVTVGEVSRGINVLQSFFGFKTAVIAGDGSNFRGIYNCRGIEKIVLPEKITDWRVDKLWGTGGEIYGCDALAEVVGLGIEHVTNLILAEGLSRFFVFPKLSLSNIEKADSFSESQFSKMEYQKPAKIPEVKRAVTLGYVIYPDLYQGDIAKEYEEYAIKQRKGILQLAFVLDRAEAIKFYDERKKITVKNFYDEYWLYAQQLNAKQCIAMLEKWQQENFSEADWKKFNNTDFYAEKYMKKVWEYEPTKRYKNAVEITKYKIKNHGKETVIPEKIGDYKVRCIGEHAFFGETIRSVIIPKNVRIIKHGAFSCCRFLESVTIPFGEIKEINGDAFRECRRLKEIVIPKGLKKIEYSTFRFCGNLTKVVMPEGVEIIGGSAFSNCHKLKEIVLPVGLKEICDHAFIYCESLTNVTLPAGLKKIASSAFSYCKGLTDIIIPESVTDIGRDAFRGCNNLTIHAPAGSRAEAYAKENKIPFEPVE